MAVSGRGGGGCSLGWRKRQKKMQMVCLIHEKKTIHQQQRKSTRNGQKTHWVGEMSPHLNHKKKREEKRPLYQYVISWVKRACMKLGSLKGGRHHARRGRGGGSKSDEGVDERGKKSAVGRRPTAGQTSVLVGINYKTGRSEYHGEAKRGSAEG